jgi:hypothetical protein
MSLKILRSSQINFKIGEIYLLGELLRKSVVMQ